MVVDAVGGSCPFNSHSTPQVVHYFLSQKEAVVRWILQIKFVHRIPILCAEFSFLVDVSKW